MKTKIYGASDDLIEIDGAISDEVNDGDSMSFSASDGTKGTISYGNEGSWKISLTNKGKKFLGIVKSVGDDVEHIFPDAIGCSSYSDVLILDEGIEWVKIGKKTFKNKNLKHETSVIQGRKVTCPSCDEEFILEEEESKNQSKSLIFVFTGFRDADMKQELEDAGFEVADNVSKKTTHLIVKDRSKTTTKMQKASDLGCIIWNIAELQEFIARQ